MRGYKNYRKLTTEVTVMKQVGNERGTRTVFFFSSFYVSYMGDTTKFISRHTRNNVGLTSAIIPGIMGATASS